MGLKSDDNFILKYPPPFWPKKTYAVENAMTHAEFPKHLKMTHAEFSKMLNFKVS